MIRALPTILAAALTACASPCKADTEERNAPVHAAARYLISACNSTGQFRYRINTNPSVDVAPKYNILRHAGAIYALCLYESRYPAAATRTAIARACHYMQRNAIGEVGIQTNMLAIWSRPEINFGNSAPQAKLGGTGLGLVALVSAERLGIITTDPTQLTKLAEFIRFMQTRDGRFISKYIPSQGGRSDRWASLYYPGEAALGLIMLYELDPNPAWLNSARQALLYLAAERESDTNLPPDHWTLIATRHLLQHAPFTPHSPERERLRIHAAQICRSMVSTRATTTRDMGFTGDGRTCPSATRLEGLIAALPLLTNAAQKTRTQIAIDEGIAFLLDTQLQSGIGQGGWPRAIAPLPKGHPFYTSSFNRRATEVRIDYVQHALSALLMYETLQHP